MPPSFPPRRSSELRVLDESVTYARQRSQFGRPIGEFQLVQAMLADSQAELYAGWSMAQDCARRYDNKPAGQSDPDVSMRARSEEHTSELQSLMRISYAVFCLKKKKQIQKKT